MCSWCYDVQIQSDVQRGNPLTTTGGHVWDAAKRLAQYFDAEKENLKLGREGLKILELGAGCGWLGLVIARNLPGAKVCMTEMEFGGALEHLAHNVELNRSSHPYDNVVVADCDWSHWGKSKEVAAEEVVAEDAESNAAKPSGVDRSVLETDWDLIVGSGALLSSFEDLVYNEIGVQWLPKVMAGLLERGRSGVIYYCHTKHRMDMADQDFLSNLAALRLSCTEVRETGTETPPASPPFFESLFPEQRIAIWRIQRAEQSVDFARELYVAPANSES